MEDQHSPLNGGFSYRMQLQQGALSVLDVLATRFPHSTRQQWAVRIARGEVELTGRILQEDQAARAGQWLIWHRPPWAEDSVPLHYQLIFEDADLLAVCKPAGLPTMPGGGFLEHTLLHLVRLTWPAAVPLHRLGRGTSGLVLFALNAASAAVLAQAWRGRRIGKVYRALAQGWAVQERYHIQTPIGPVPHPRLGEVFAASPDGKPAESHAQVLKRQATATLFEVQIVTGRPHQIRVHLASIGHPLVGDPLYGPGGLPLTERPGLPGDLGYWLHAQQLRFPHPSDGRWLTLHAETPSELC